MLASVTYMITSCIFHIDRMTLWTVKHVLAYWWTDRRTSGWIVKLAVVRIRWRSSRLRAEHWNKHIEDILKFLIRILA